MNIQAILSEQRSFFKTGATLPVKFRIEALKKLKKVILAHEQEIHTALKNDLCKSEVESYMCEVGMVLSEITYMLKHIKKLTQNKTVWTSLVHFLSHSYKKPSPYGNCLIISPWNYPFLLTFGPIIDAIATGNTAIIKPSELSVFSSQIIEKIILECFDKKYMCVVLGGVEVSLDLLNEKFDFIFFTGSTRVGKEVLNHASQYLTPTVLELGGKSPCIVDETANIPLAAKRIVFGKFLNAGQTCVAPDYIICHKSVGDKLISELIDQIKKQYGETPLTNDSYVKIINEKHFNRLKNLIEPQTVKFGGQVSEEKLKIEPTLLFNVGWDSLVMQDEIFGPILPIMTYQTNEELLDILLSRPKPLAFYIFSTSKQHIQQLTNRCSFGGGCINDTIIHLATSEMGFGGVGESGMGAYHGKEGFYAFSHMKSIVDKKNILDFPFRYAPYNKLFYRVVRLFLR